MLLFENLIAIQMVKKFFSFHGTKMIIGPSNSVLSQTKSVSIHVSDLFIKTPFHTLLHLHLTILMDSTHVFYRYFVGISPSHNTCYIPHPSYSPVTIIMFQMRRQCRIVYQIQDRLTFLLILLILHK